MKKIMFNDKYGLTDAVLSRLRRKTQTRRIGFSKEEQAELERKAHLGVSIVDNHVVVYDPFGFVVFSKPTHYKVGEVVAVAQSYKNAGVRFIPGEDDEFGCYDFPAEHTKGWNNKMFVRADLMPNKIRITNIRIERLQDISDEDVLKEGFYIEKVNDNMGHCAYHYEYQLMYCDSLDRYCFIHSPSAQESYSYLIDRIAGIGTWERNPYVIVYDFELVK